MALIGYARVSIQDQNLELQREALEQAGCDRIYTDQLSGTRADRPGLTEALDYARPGDTLVIWKLDRLGRSMPHLVETARDLDNREIHLRSLTDEIDTTTAAGRFFFHVMAALADMERDLIVERTRAGLEAARRKGRVGGRRRKMTGAKIESGKPCWPPANRQPKWPHHWAYPAPRCIGTAYQTPRRPPLATIGYEPWPPRPIDVPRATETSQEPMCACAAVPS